MDTIVEWKETEWVLSDTPILPETTISGNLNPYLKFYRWMHEEPKKEERKPEVVIKPELSEEPPANTVFIHPEAKQFLIEENRKLRAKQEAQIESEWFSWDGLWIVLVIIGAVIAALAPIVLAFGAVLIASMADSVCG